LIDIKSARATISNTYFGRNINSYNGTIKSYKSNIDIQNSIFDSNQCNHGSAIYQSYYDLNIEGSTFIGNADSNATQHTSIESLIYISEKTYFTISNTSLSSGSDPFDKIDLIGCHNSTITYYSATISKGKDDLVVNCKKCSLKNKSKSTDLYYGRMSPTAKRNIALIVCLSVGVPLIVIIGVIVYVKTKKQKSTKPNDIQLH